MSVCMLRGGMDVEVEVTCAANTFHVESLAEAAHVLIDNAGV